MLKVGMCIDNYELIELIGSGGMGEVFAVKTLEQDGDVTELALKLIRAEWIDDELTRRRFRREIDVLQTLCHPNLVSVLDSGEYQGRLYWTMKKLIGEDLGLFIKRDGRLTSSEIRQIFVPVADSLCYAHEHGIVHGDLKPENIFLTAEGTRVLDFGAAKIIGLDRLTRTGEIAGTPAFLAPELITSSSEASGSLDSYGLGATLFFAINGTSPFPGNNVGKILLDVASGKRSGHRDGIPTKMANLIDALMHIEVAKRPSVSEARSVLMEAH